MVPRLRKIINQNLFDSMTANNGKNLIKKCSKEDLVNNLENHLANHLENNLEKIPNWKNKIRCILSKLGKK